MFDKAEAPSQRCPSSRAIVNICAVFASAPLTKTSGAGPPAARFKFHHPMGHYYREASELFWVKATMGITHHDAADHHQDAAGIYLMNKLALYVGQDLEFPTRIDIEAEQFPNLLGDVLRRRLDGGASYERQLGLVFLLGEIMKPLLPFQADVNHVEKVWTWALYVLSVEGLENLMDCPQTCRAQRTLAVCIFLTAFCLSS